MNRAEVIHLASQSYIDGLSLEQLNKYVYDTVRANLETLDNIDLEDTINRVFPEVAEKVTGIESDVIDTSDDVPRGKRYAVPPTFSVGYGMANFLMNKSRR